MDPQTVSEADRQLSSKNASAIVSAWRDLGAVLKRAFGAAPTDDEGDQEEPTEEAIREALSHRDIDRALELALRQAHPLRDEYVWVRDVFDGEVIYELSQRGREMGSPTLYRRTYSITDDGTVSLGEPEPVVAQMVYSPADADATPEAASESVALTSELVPLIERAVRSDNTVPLKLIQPGWGSSGYYSADVLKRDGPGIFTEGLHMYLNHPTETEAQERPERDVRDLAGRLTSNATWQENGAAGPGLYADAEVFQPFRGVLDELAPHIGVSIRAGGLVSEGEAGGQRGRIVEQLVRADSVDYVTRAGAGGQVVTIMESARSAQAAPQATPTAPATGPAAGTAQVQEAQVEEELREMRTENAAMKAQLARLSGLRLLDEARSAASTQLATVDLPSFAKRRILEAVTADPAEADGVLDKAALTAAVEAAVTSWRTDLAEASGSYAIEGMGPGSGEPISDEDLDGVLGEAFQAMGLRESTAQLAVRGR